MKTQLWMLAAAALLFSQCSSGDQMTVAGNPSVNPSSRITIGKLTNGTSRISVPLDVFGLIAAERPGSSIQVFRNPNTLLTTVQYSAAIESAGGAEFDLNSLSAGDELSFRVRLSSGVTPTYTGVVSAQGDSFATSPQACIEQAQRVLSAARCWKGAASGVDLEVTFLPFSTTSDSGDIIQEYVQGSNDDTVDYSYTITSCDGGEVELDDGQTRIVYNSTQMTFDYEPNGVTFTLRATSNCEFEHLH